MKNLNDKQLTRWMNDLCKTDAYSSALLKIVKGLQNANPLDFKYEIRDVGYNGFVVYNERNHNKGYLPKVAATGEYKDFITKDNIAFFIQPGALSYSPYEILTVDMKSLIPDVISDVQMTLKHKDEIFRNIFITILKDFG